MDKYNKPLIIFVVVVVSGASLLQANCFFVFCLFLFLLLFFSDRKRDGDRERGKGMIALKFPPVRWGLDSDLNHV